MVHPKIIFYVVWDGCKLMLGRYSKMSSFMLSMGMERKPYPLRGILLSLPDLNGAPARSQDFFCCASILCPGLPLRMGCAKCRRNV